jgi:hypothetical protein
MTKALHQRTGEGFAVVCGSTLFLMAFGALFNVESLLAVMAGIAGLAVFHVRHLKRTFLHPEELGLGMAVGALGTRIDMSLTIEYDTAFPAAVVFNFLSGTYCHRQSGNTEHETNYNKNTKQSFHKNLRFYVELVAT